MREKTVIEHMNTCPKCGKDLVIIEGMFVKWLNCPNCKFKKLVKNEKKKIIKTTTL